MNGVIQSFSLYDPDFSVSLDYILDSPESLAYIIHG